MAHNFYQDVEETLLKIKEEGLYKTEKTITSPQKGSVAIKERENPVINCCANNYLGLADNKEIISTSKEAMDTHGFGMASVRFICGTQDLHTKLEAKIASFLGMEDCILYTSCFDANTGLFETILTSEDAIVSDALNHASIIDGVRLCKAKRFRYQNNDMESLEEALKSAKEQGAKNTLIVTDGVFSMDGVIADLPSICDLADKYGALVMVDDSHAVGFMGKGGRGTHEYHDVMDRIDIITGTLGKALGGASGGYTCAKSPVVDLLRQRSRPYLFSNAVAPSIVAASIKAIDIIEERGDLRQRLWENSTYFREEMQKAGFTLAGADHAIIPIMLEDAKLANEFAAECLKEDIYVVAFSYPVVPKNKARIRTQMSAAHSKEELEYVINVMKKVGKKLNII